MSQGQAMLANTQELTVALRSLIILEKSLGALRGQLATANPGLLATMSPAHVQRIESLQAEIAIYLYAHPSDASRRPT